VQDRAGGGPDAQLGAGARGIAVVDSGVSDEELERLTRAGMRGVRFLLEYAKAEEALGMGLVNFVVDEEDVVERAAEIADRLAAGPGVAISASKVPINKYIKMVSNLVLPLSIAGRKPDRAWVDQLIATVGLEDRRTHRPSELSGGQQQRVAVARALVNEPVLLLADEPTGNLDPDLAYEIMSLFQDINARGTTVLVATHDRELITRMGKRVILLEQGRVVES